MIRLQSRRFTLVALAAFAAFTVAPMVGTAGTVDEEDVYRDNSDISKIFHKLGRGVGNVLLGWVEIPKNIAKEWRRHDPLTGTITGTFKGFGWGIARTLAGCYEVISFPFPVPRDYKPIMNPEFVLPTIWGDRLPMFRNEYMAGSTLDAAVDYGTTNPGVTPPSTTTTTGTRTY